MDATTLTKGLLIVTYEIYFSSFIAAVFVCVTAALLQLVFPLEDSDLTQSSSAQILCGGVLRMFGLRRQGVLACQVTYISSFNKRLVVLTVFTMKNSANFNLASNITME